MSKEVFWMILGSGAPLHRHMTADSAKVEAERLAGLDSVAVDPSSLNKFVAAATNTKVMIWPIRQRQIGYSTGGSSFVRRVGIKGALKLVTADWNALAVMRRASRGACINERQYRR